MEKNTWEILSEILKKEVNSSKFSLLQISIKLGIDKITLQRYLNGDFSGPEIYVKHHLSKLKDFLNIEEDLVALYLEGKSKKIKNQEEFHEDEKESKKYIIPYLLFIILSVFLFSISLFLFIKVLNAPLVSVSALNGTIELNEKVVKEGKLNEGEYYIKGPAIFEKINNKVKKVLMDEYLVVIKWGK
ncbi:MAG: hypothetical protein PWP54_668 [Thermosipho sp. (in: thermotogales)]|nr:hypothetical protein [Thermosipho sp. (in: thermotogales)]